ncbi:outer membrane receptor protein involved in Fe transport [Litorivivens lipolytica]|uniref:Outer membrane receptor protein involved in Fe transport n=1 Tax=Litorivivens lipolytica TaxID=1524264 RepID=A0A7W4W717_9GAMM|nr:TonB-dependent receptor [Litorivivens lipolytica]MBB3048609.1 outer membrane receptor protein involved in Fe transport [Litorivivens lipolytica]
MKKPFSLLAGAALSLVGSPVFAQSAESGAAPSSDQKATALEEVIVTARRRAENIQETPIAVTAISGEALREQGIVNTSELTKSVPSLQINEGQSNQIYIRGIGERSGFARVDPTVGVYLDDLFLPRTDGQLLDTVDVRSIQVLRGPQGTLFGKNTTGGALVLTLEKPNDTYEGYVEGTLGNYNARSFRAGLNMPITDNFYTRLAITVDKDDGFFEDKFQGSTYSSNDRKALVLQTRYEGEESLVLDTLFYAGKIDESFPAINCDFSSENGLFGEGLYVMWAGDTDPSNPTAYRENCEANSRTKGSVGDLETNMGANPMLDKRLDTFLFGLTAEWDYSDDITMKVVFGARKETEGPIASSDNDGGPENWSEAMNTDDGERDSFSLEYQVNGSAFDSRLNYTGGLFYMRETNFEPFGLLTNFAGVDAVTLGELAAGQIPSQPPQGGTTPFVGILSGPFTLSEFDLENNTFASFFQGSYDLTENLQVTAGIRYTAEKRASELAIFQADTDAISARVVGQPFISPATNNVITFGPSAGGFHQCLGGCTWRDDPVRVFQNQFLDNNGDGIPDIPMRDTPTFIDKKEKTFSKVTPMASVSYNLPPEWLDDSVLDSMMIYGTWSTGFKSGFFEPRLLDGLQEVAAEEVENREIGFKIDAFERSLRFNVALYHMDFDNMQLIQVSTDSAGNLAVIFRNAGASTITGGEMELTWMPSPIVMLNASFSKNDYEFQEFKDNDLLTAAATGNFVPEDRTDETFPASPETTASFGAQLMLPTDFGLIIPRVDLSYKSEIFFGLDEGSYNVYQRTGEGLGGSDAYTLVDVRLSWQNNEGDTTVAAFVKNVTDERYVIGTASVSDSVSTFNQTYGDPRRFGLMVRKTF